MQYVRGIGLQSGDLGRLAAAATRNPAPNDFNAFQQAIKINGRGVTSTEATRIRQIYYGNDLPSRLASPMHNAAAVSGDLLSGTGKAAIFWNGTSFIYGLTDSLGGPLQPDNLLGTGHHLLPGYDAGVRVGSVLQVIAACTEDKSCFP
jgi:hypothetical protein